MPNSMTQSVASSLLDVIIINLEACLKSHPHEACTPQQLQTLIIVLRSSNSALKNFDRVMLLKRLSKVIRDCFSFALLCSVILFDKTYAILTQSISRCKT